MFSIFPIIYALSLIAPLIHLLFLKPRKKAFGEIIEIVLLYQLVFSVGIASLFGFYGHLFMSDTIAEYIGWPKGNPFQLEVAYANLAFGILGLLCLMVRGHFWTATVFGISIWYLGDAYVHLLDLTQHHNYAPGNAGLPLYVDIVVPIFLLILWAIWQYLYPARISFQKERNHF